MIDGMSAILTCETSGAPRPAITWQKGKGRGAKGSWAQGTCPGHGGSDAVGPG